MLRCPARTNKCFVETTKVKKNCTEYRYTIIIIDTVSADPLICTIFEPDESQGLIQNGKTLCVIGPEYDVVVESIHQFLGVSWPAEIKGKTMYLLCARRWVPGLHPAL